MPKKKRAKIGSKVSHWLIFLGAVIMLVGASAELSPYATFSLSPTQGIQATGLKPIDVSLLTIGAIFFFAGIALYLKGK